MSSEPVTRELARIADEMKACDTNDCEAAHAEGDDLLVEALQLLAGQSETEHRQLVERIIALYGNLCKWYA